MKNMIFVLAMAALAAAPLTAAAQETGRMDERLPEARVAAGQMCERLTEAGVDDAVHQWPAGSRRIAHAMIEKYGLPSEATPSLLVWHNNGPWRRSVVYRSETVHNFPMRHFDVLEQAINYSVPANRLYDLARFNGSVLVDRTWGKLAVRGDSEAMNLLALNLAIEVIEGKKSVSEARRFFARTAEEYFSGRWSPYTERLVFIVPTGSTTEQDQPYSNSMSEPD